MSSARAERPTVLVLRALGLGDLATAVPALRGIRRSFPDHRIVLASSAWLAPLVAVMDFVDELLPSEELAGLPVQMDVDDVAVNLHGRGPVSTLVLADTAPSRLIAFTHPDVPATYGLPVWKRKEHEVTRWCRLLQESGLDARPDDISLPVPGLEPGPLAGATVLHPGASAPARQWPPDRWAVVARSLAQLGEKVVITGNAAEVPLAREIAREARLGSDSVRAGRTDLGALAVLIANAGMVLSGDTGPAHLATAFGTPSVTLFGPTSPHEWGPPPGQRHQVIWKGRTGLANGVAPDPGLMDISVQEVLDAVQELSSLRAPPPPSPPPRGRTPTAPVGPGDHRPPGVPPKDGS